jgi:hypothetical protein
MTLRSKPPKDSLPTIATLLLYEASAAASTRSRMSSSFRFGSSSSICASGTSSAHSSASTDCSDGMSHCSSTDSAGT